MSRSIAALGLVAFLAVAVAGCGSSNSERSASSTTTGTGAASTPSTTATPEQTESTTTQSGNRGSGSGRSGEPSGGSGSSGNSGDNSIQTYGSEATGDERAAVVSAMRSFFRAFASSDYAKVCSGLSSKTRAGLEQYLKLKHEQGKDCASLLSTILSSAGAEARKAASATVVKVRVGEGNSFVIFKPSGGKLSYFVMKREDGEWKSTSLSVGTPFP